MVVSHRTYCSNIVKCQFDFVSAVVEPCLGHAGAAHWWWTHLGQHLIQPLEGAVEMQLNPTGSAGYCLTSVGIKYRVRVREKHRMSSAWSRWVVKCHRMWYVMGLLIIMFTSTVYRWVSEWYFLSDLCDCARQRSIHTHCYPSYYLSVLQRWPFWFESPNVTKYLIETVVA